MFDQEVLKEAVKKYCDEKGFWIISSYLEESGLADIPNAKFDVLFYETDNLVLAEEVRGELHADDYVYLSSLKIKNVRQLVRKLTKDEKYRVYFRPSKQYMIRFLGLSGKHELSKYFDIKTHGVI